MQENESVQNQQIKLFQDSKIRSVWDEEEQQRLLQVGYERILEIENPELAQER